MPQSTWTSANKSGVNVARLGCPHAIGIRHLHPGFSLPGG